jgi:hypothetical protein
MYQSGRGRGHNRIKEEHVSKWKRERRQQNKGRTCIKVEEGEEATE